MKARSLVTLCAAATLNACESPAVMAPTAAVSSNGVSYEIADLGTLGGAAAFGDQINVLGHVAGRSQNAAGEYRVFLWDGSVMQDLGPIFSCCSKVWLNDNDQVAWTGPAADGSRRAFLWDNGAARDLGTLGGTFSLVEAVNNQGQVVGTSGVDSSTTPWSGGHAFLWQDGVITDLGTFGGASSQATAINDKGQVVGTSALDSTSSHAFLWQDGAMTDLGSFSPKAINKAGWIVGTTWNPGNPHYATLWREGELVNLGTLPGDFGSVGLAVNARGEIAGINCQELGCDERHPFVWKAGKMTALAPEYPFPYWQVVVAINGDGLVIGNRRVNSHTSVGVVWEANGVGQNLGTFGGAQSGALDIDAAGTVVGWAETASGEHHAALWRRVTTPAILAKKP